MTNGAYLQVFDVKSRRGLCAVPSGCAAAKMLEGYFRALSAWRESALGAFRPTRLRGPFPLCAPRYMEGAGGTPPDRDPPDLRVLPQ